MKNIILILCISYTASKPQKSQKPVAVWADELEEYDSEEYLDNASSQPAVWADELESRQVEERIDHQHFLPIIGESQTLELVNSEKIVSRIDEAEDVNSLGNETRQLESIAFPIGIAIGAIGAAVLPAIFPGSTTTTTTTAAPDSNNLGSSIDQVSVNDPFTSTTIKSTSTTYEPRSIFEDFPECGFKGSSTRVIGGENILENEYPWLCSLKYRDSHICGMTLLSGPPHDTILVGAAHCFSPGDDVNKYTITCGEHSLQRHDDSEVKLQVTEVITHPRYTEASTSGYDIAVYKVNDRPLYGKMVEKKLWPACLPDINRDFYSEKSFVAGWGITQTKLIHGSKIQVKGIPDIAQHTSVTVKKCVDDDNFDYPKGLICASDHGQDSCQGDSGGPLIGIASQYSDPVDKRYSWIGVVSFGVGCAEPGYPGAYTRSSCYLGFIAEQFGLKADFSVAGDHPEWSTDCGSGASRMSSAVNRYTRLPNKKHKKHRKKNKNRKNKTSRTEADTITFVDKSELITLEKLNEEAEAESRLEKEEEKKEHKNGDNGLINGILDHLFKPFLS